MSRHVHTQMKWAGRCTIVFTSAQPQASRPVLVTLSPTVIGVLVIVCIIICQGEAVIYYLVSSVKLLCYCLSSRLLLMRSMRSLMLLLVWEINEIVTVACMRDRWDRYCCLYEKLMRSLLLLVWEIDEIVVFYVVEIEHPDRFVLVVWWVVFVLRCVSASNNHICQATMRYIYLERLNCIEFVRNECMNINAWMSTWYYDWIELYLNWQCGCILNFEATARSYIYHQLAVVCNWFIIISHCYYWQRMRRDVGKFVNR